MRARSFIDLLKASLREVHDTMKAGNCMFVFDGLAFIALPGKYHEALIPCNFLLLRIKEKHIQGLTIYACCGADILWITLWMKYSGWKLGSRHSCARDAGQIRPIL